MLKIKQTNEKKKIRKKKKETEKKMNTLFKIVN